MNASCSLVSTGFVAQIQLRTNRPKPHTDLRHVHRHWRTQLREAV
ncbi:MAG: hypothetical protein RL571_2408 [Pseudomonadota bacterium]|jgi:hypothetical protein